MLCAAGVRQPKKHDLTRNVGDDDDDDEESNINKMERTGLRA